MHDTTSALPGFKYEGLVRVAEGGARGMITLRGDLATPRLAQALQAHLGAPMPGQRRVTNGAGGGAVAWMSPDELLILTEHGAVPAMIAALEGATTGEFVTLADVSDARAVFTIKGVQARDVLAKICPVDFDALRPGQIRRTRAAQVAAALICEDDDCFALICFRSVAHYMADLLATVSAPGGAVGLYR
ncbi:MAG TPA: sarcosine oxidase subunit gamma [Paracoccus sp.]|nr:sarcosine oxidase subunit gamma [Paracoccus sp. (in: a-proteobacteria)]